MTAQVVPDEQKTVSEVPAARVYPSNRPRRASKPASEKLGFGALSVVVGAGVLPPVFFTH